MPWFELLICSTPHWHSNCVLERCLACITRGVHSTDALTGSCCGLMYPMPGILHVISQPTHPSIMWNVSCRSYMYFWGKGRKIARNKLIRLCEEQPAHGVVLEQAKVHCVFFGFHQPLCKGQCAGSGAKRHLPHPDYAPSWCWRGVVFGLQAAGSHNHKKNADCNPANFCKVCFWQFSFISKLFLSNLNSKPDENGKRRRNLENIPFQVDVHFFRREAVLCKVRFGGCPKFVCGTRSSTGKCGAARTTAPWGGHGKHGSLGLLQLPFADGFHRFYPKFFRFSKKFAVSSSGRLVDWF